jgi:hypothetical protein
MVRIIDKISISSLDILSHSYFRRSRAKLNRSPSLSYAQHAVAGQIYWQQVDLNTAPNWFYLYVTIFRKKQDVCANEKMLD